MTCYLSFFGFLFAYVCVLEAASTPLIDVIDRLNSLVVGPSCGSKMFKVKSCATMCYYTTSRLMRSDEAMIFQYYGNLHMTQAALCADGSALLKADVPTQVGPGCICIILYIYIYFIE